MGFRVEGLDKAIKIIEELQESLEPDVQDRWTNNIVNKAREICNDPDCRRIRLKKNEQGIAVIDYDDAFAIDCIIKAIDQLSKDMPMGIRDWLRLVLVPQLEADRKKMTDY